MLQEEEMIQQFADQYIQTLLQQQSTDQVASAQGLEQQVMQGA